MGSQQFRLRWNNHQANMLSVFEHLLSIEALVDVTLVCEGLSLKAHKVVLSACSDFFQEIFIENPCKHPVIILKDMRNADLNAIIDFMYRGEVSVSRDELPALLKAAETLKVKGLTEASGDKKPGMVSDIIQDSILKQAFNNSVQASATDTTKENITRYSDANLENSAQNITFKSDTMDSITKVNSRSNKETIPSSTEANSETCATLRENETPEQIHGTLNSELGLVYSQEGSDIDMDESTSEDDGQYDVMDASTLMEQSMMTNEIVPKFEIVKTSRFSPTNALDSATSLQSKGFENSHNTNPNSIKPSADVKPFSTYNELPFPTIKSEPDIVPDLHLPESRTTSQQQFISHIPAFTSNINFTIHNPSMAVPDLSMLRARLNVAREPSACETVASSSTNPMKNYSRSFQTYGTGSNSEFGQDLTPGAKPHKVKKQLKFNRNGVPQPKRASTAYINFTMWYREQIKRSGRPLPRIGVFGKECASKWNVMSEEEKAPFRKKADTDKERYRREMQVYRPARDANKPKRPGTAFMLFMSDFRKLMAGQEPEGGVAALSKLGAEKWRAMTEDEKSSYLKLQHEEKVQYDNVMREYRRINALALVADSTKNVAHLDDGSDDSFDSTDINLVSTPHASSNISVPHSQSTLPQALPSSHGR